MSDLIEDFRQNIRKLKPDGADGFEGLMAAVLSDLTKRSFTLAKSGSQHGRDGQSALDGGTILFEAKRYDDTVPKDKIYTKIVEIAADKTSTTELYIVGATCPFPAQYITTLQGGTERLGIELLMLAWPENNLPELAAILAMASDISVKFIAKHTSVTESELATQLAEVKSHPQFQARSDELLSILLQPSIAPAFALKNNIAWLSAVFSDKSRSRSAFGQALSPADVSMPSTLDRTDLRTKIANEIFTKPNGSVTAILGADGNGKSWIFAQAWSFQPNRPLTIVIIPDDIAAPPSFESCQDLIISKLITQTGETPRSDSRERWIRHFERWKRNIENVAPRLIIFIDGVNQRESVNWLRFIEIMSTIVGQLGGKLVFSCRHVFYRDNLEGNLVSQIVTIDVPEWTDQELDRLLKEQGASISSLDPAIVRSLRNPRIFGVAATLFKADEIKEFGELSVNRLLFEHIRSGSAVAGAIVSSKKFSADICAHAERIVQRLKEQQCDSLNEFEISTAVTSGYSDRDTSERFAITSAGRFFEVLDENPNKYVLKDEGLPLALGLALVRTAREALRKQKSVDEALSNILDPIMALDRTSDVLLGAILSSVLEDDPAEIVASLVRVFVMLQNLDASRYPEFRSLFGRNPEAFLSALECSMLTRDIASNLSWLTDAMSDLRGNEAFEAVLGLSIRRWLNMYSLAAERMVWIPNDLDHAADREKKLAEREHVLSLTIASLSQAEQDILAGMIREDRGDYNQLNLLAFLALANRPLASFAENLRNWCFAASLNGGYSNRHDDFDNLLHFNLVDWSATKEALLKAAIPLCQDGVSNTGRWALVSILRATGDSSDAKQADMLAEEMTKDREHIKGWRRIEDYCASDPCDPKSEIPENIDKTAKDYKGINPAELCKFMGWTQSDHFFTDAQPGLARFCPEVAVEGLRILADQALTRAQPEFRQAIFRLECHTICLEDRIAALYVEKARELAQAALDAGEDKNNELLIAAQYALGVAFPHMTGDAQFDALINHPASKTVLLNLCHLFQPIDANKLELALDRAIQESNTIAQFRTLCFAEYSKTPLTARSNELVLSLLSSQDEHVRLSVLSIIHATAIPNLLSGLVQSGWSAAQFDTVSNKVEIFHGSQALALAAEQGMITLETCLDRITPSAYEYLVEQLGFDAAMAIAKRLNTAIHKAIEYQVPANLPDIEQNFEGNHWPVLLNVSEKQIEEENPQMQLSRHTESHDVWYERQKLNQEVADRFERDLTKAGAQLIIQSVTVSLIAKIDKVAPAYVDSWHVLFLKLDNKALNNVHNIASMVADALSQRDLVASLSLFNRLRKSSPHVRVTFGRDKIDLNAVVVWDATDSDEINALRFDRLDRASNDHDLAMEVLAAVRANRLDILRDYVTERRQRSEPAHRARATMVAGLSPDEAWAIETIEMLKDECGFLQRAYQGAQYAMERHQWTRYWAAKMGTATDPVDVWRYMVLFTKIVDGRFQSSEVEGSVPSPLIKRFGYTFNSSIRDRIRSWKDKRASKLFGMNIPNKAFLPSD